MSEYSAYPFLLHSFLPLNYPPQLREVLLAVVWQLPAVTLLSLHCVCLDTSCSRGSWSPFRVASRYPAPFFRDQGEVAEKLLCLKSNYLLEKLSRAYVGLSIG